MARTLSVGLAAHIAQHATTLCRLMRVDCRDGTTYGFTDHDQDLTFDGGFGSLLYRSGAGLLPSDISLSIGLDADNCEIMIPFGEEVGDITLDGLLGLRFTRARVRIFDVNWSDLTQGAAHILWGKIATARAEGGKGIFEVRSATDAYNQVQGRVMVPTCDADFGDARCQKVREEFITSVTAVTSEFQFTIDTYAMPAVPFDFGTLEFASGALAGIPEQEIFTINEGTGVVELLVPLPEAPQVGDDLTLFNGCSKLKKSDDVTVPTCLFYENVVNFRGWDQVPGSDVFLRPQIPGSNGV